MHVRFLLGPAGSGKTSRCLAEIRQALEAPEGPPLLVLAPKQATFQLERQILAGPRVAGYTRLQILSFERLAAQLLEDFLGMAPRLLEEEGRLMVLRALLMEKQSALRIFHATARLPGFARQLSLLLRECHRSQVTPRRLREVAGRLRDASALSLKLTDLALLAEAYQEWLVSQDLQDGATLLDLAAEQLKSLEVEGASSGAASRVECRSSGPGAVYLEQVWLDGFAELTPQELELLAAVIPGCRKVTLAFCLDHDPQEDPAWLSTWSVVGQTYRRCRQRVSGIPGIQVSTEVLTREAGQGRFQTNAALRHLEANWAAAEARKFVATPLSGRAPDRQELDEPPPTDLSQSLQVVRCLNPEAEALWAAREVLSFVRERRARFRDCAVLVRSQGAYHAILRRVFSRYDIPFFMDRREPVGHHPMAELTRSALRVAALHWRHEDFFSALKSGLAGLEETGVDWLENAALARGWTGDDWLQALLDRGDAAGLDRAEAMRLRVVPPFERLAKGLSAETPSGPSGGEIARTLRGFWDQLKVREQLEEWSEMTEAGGMQPRSIHLTVWEEMQGWLENLELAFPERRMPLREWLPILESGMASLTVGVIPPALDQVLIGTIDRSRNPELKLAVVLGVNEGVFPAPPAPPTILTEAERSRLALEELPLGISARRYLGHERYYGYIAFSRATERLVVAWSATDAESRPLNPSPFIGQLQRMFPEAEMGDFSGAAAWWQAEHVSDLAGPLVRSRAAGSSRGAAVVPSPAQLPEGMVTRWARLPSLGRLDERCRVLLETGALTILSPDLAERLYGTRLTTSVSALEDFAACPFKFFVARGMEAKERELFETDVRERGSFQHELLERFHAEVRRSGRRWRDLAPIEAVALTERLGAELMRQYRGGLFERSSEAAYLGRHMTERVAQMLGVLVRWMAQYRFDPVAVELAFGMDAAGLPGWRLALDEHHELYLRGRIDRVDVCAAAETAVPLAVVIDYKSSHKTLLPIRLEHGLQLQLLSYLGVLRNSPDLTRSVGAERVEPIGVFYISMRPERLSAESRAEGLEKAGEATAASYRHQGRFDRSFLSYLDRRGVSKGDQFVYSKNKDGEFALRGNQGLTSEAFRQLERQVEERLRAFGSRIYLGQIEAAPYQIKKERACEFCEFRSVCRFDPWTGGFRVLREGGAS